MAYNRNQVQNVIDALNRAQNLDAKAKTVVAAAKLGVDDNEDFGVSNAAQIQAYVVEKRALRDSILAQAQPIVAAWTP